MRLLGLFLLSVVSAAAMFALALGFCYLIWKAPSDNEVTNDKK